MDRREIEIFTTVMRLGSVTAAAQSLGIAQPSVSKAIALMEHRLSFPLFERVKGRLFPTAEAALVFEEAIQIEHDLARFDRYLYSVRNLRVGQLRVAATPALAISLLPLVATMFRQKLPNHGLVLDMHLNHEISGLVERGQYDLGLAVIPTSDESSALSPIRRGRMVCVLPASHPLADAAHVEWNDINTSDFIYITTDARLVALVASRVPGFDQRLDAALETNRYTTAVNLVRQGLGVTLVDEFTLVGEPMDGLAVKAFEPALHVSLVSSTAIRQSPKKSIEAMIGQIEQVLEVASP